LINSAANQIKVVIGTPINREHAYILEKFLDNQKQVQQAYHDCELVLATSDTSFARELQGFLTNAQLHGNALTHVPEKPAYSRHWIWDVTSGREAIRQHAVANTGVDYLLYLDADMLFESDVVSQMLKHIEGYDVLFNGYALRGHGTGLSGARCLMLKRRVFDKIHFHCCEFKHGEVIFEDNLLEMDLFRLHAGVKKGFYVTTDHYQDAHSFKHMEPQPTGKIRALTNYPIIRYTLIKSSLVLHYNIPWRLRNFLNRLSGNWKRPKPTTVAKSC
jgi:hypothetical protein